jgi:NTP pyrophosphatase (non-canonical NTP hydrolase)
MTLNEYQSLAQRTSSTHLVSAMIENGILGLCGETGEVADIYKKYLYQGHEFDREAMKIELGDVLWYVAELATGLGVTLEEVAAGNIEKLRKRYPDGFEARRSVEREEEAHG